MTGSPPHSAAGSSLKPASARPPAGGAQRAATPPSPTSPTPAAPYDVWSRPGSGYHLRAIALLFVNVLLFAGVGGFTYWLRTGVVFAPGQPDYWATWQAAWLDVANGPVNLTSVLVAPISVQYVPMLIPIVGLLTAALVAVPILVAILYRFWASLPFVLILLFVAMTPWLAATVLLSCVIVSVRPLRFSMRFMSALLALVPVVAYLVWASGGVMPREGALYDPIDQIKFTAPLVLAVVAAAVVFAVVLTIARMVKYRPGALTPLLAALFVLPVALFEQHVGRDELSYRRLETSDRVSFADADASQALEQVALRDWLSHPAPRPSLEQLKRKTSLEWLLVLTDDAGPRESKVTQDQASLAQRCDEFLRQFPQSRYAPNVLFIKGRALDRRLDIDEFRRTKWVRLFADFPAQASRDTWLTLLDNYPESPLSAVALLRLAQLNARAGQVDRAKDQLFQLVTGSAVGLGDGLGGEVGLRERGILDRDEPVASLDISFEHIRIEAHWLYDLLSHNANDALYGYDPIGMSPSRAGPTSFGLLQLYPRHPRYIENLRRLKQMYPNCLLQDNLDLEIAKATADPDEAIALLEQCVNPQKRAGDAVPEALYRLGCALRAQGEAERAQAQFDRLQRDHAETIWAQRARRLPPLAARRVAEGGQP